MIQFYTALCSAASSHLFFFFNSLQSLVCSLNMGSTLWARLSSLGSLLPTSWCRNAYGLTKPSAVLFLGGSCDLVASLLVLWFHSKLLLTPMSLIQWARCWFCKAGISSGARAQGMCGIWGNQSCLDCSGVPTTCDFSSNLVSTGFVLLCFCLSVCNPLSFPSLCEDT